MQSAMAQTGYDSKTSQPSLEFAAVPPEQVMAVWPMLEPMVRRGLAHGQGDATTPEHMLQNIIAGNFLLWVAVVDEKPKAGVILSVRPGDTGHKIWVEMLAGDGRDLWAEELIRLLSEFRELTGSRCVEASCRPGIAKVMRRLGWKQKAVVMELI